jgi:acetoin utilization deacetylase AcuC-like enzyme
MRARAESIASRSSTSTCTTATARRRCSTPILRCSTFRSTNSRSIPGAARPKKRDADWRGYTVNVPLAAGAGEAAYGAALERIVAPVLETYRPGLLLFSAGFDAHQRDPLAQMELGEQGFKVLVQRALAAVGPEVRSALLLEGGYDLIGLGSSLGATLEGLDEGGLSRIPSGPLWQAHERDLARAAAAAELWKLG